MHKKNWNQYSGEIICILIAHKDRFLRFGFEWFEHFLQLNGTNIMIVNNEKMSPEQELIHDLTSIIHVFSCRIYGLKKYKNEIKGDEEIVKKL